MVTMKMERKNTTMRRRGEDQRRRRSRCSVVQEGGRGRIAPVRQFEYNSENGPKLDKFGNTVVEDDEEDEGETSSSTEDPNIYNVMSMMMEWTLKTSEYDIANRTLEGLTFRWGVSRT